MDHSTLGRRCDVSQYFQRCQSFSRHKNFQYIGARVRRREKDSLLLQQRIHEGHIEAGEPFQGIAVHKAQAQPQTLAAWPCREGPSAETLRIVRIVQIKVPDIEDHLYCLEIKGLSAAIHRHHSYFVLIEKASCRQVSPG